MNRNSPVIVPGDDDLGHLGYLAWVHHAMWCPARLAAMSDPISHFQRLEAQMESALRQRLAQEELPPSQLWARRRVLQPEILAELGMPPHEVDEPAWWPDTTPDQVGGEVLQMLDRLPPIDAAIVAVSEGRELTDEELAALREPNDQHRQS